MGSLAPVFPRACTFPTAPTPCTNTAHDIIYTLVIVLDPKASLLFSFIWNLQD